jgi:hypothetical protein
MSRTMLLLLLCAAGRGKNGERRKRITTWTGSTVASLPTLWHAKLRQRPRSLHHDLRQPLMHRLLLPLDPIPQNPQWRRNSGQIPVRELGRLTDSVPRSGEDEALVHQGGLPLHERREPFRFVHRLCERDSGGGRRARGRT